MWIYKWSCFWRIFINIIVSSCKVFKLQKWVISITFGAEPTASCQGLFRKLNILTVLCQYVLSLMLLIVGNPNNYQAGLEVHRLHTRSKNQHFIPNANLTSVQKGITFSGIKIYNSLPKNILSPKNNRKWFKNELYRFLLYNSFYSVKEFLEFRRDK